MADKVNLVVIEAGTAERARLTRRALVQRVLAGMTAGAAWPLVAGSHPIYRLLGSNVAILDQAEHLGAASWKPAFLTSQQNELLTTLAESIVPNSAHAHVNRFIDLLLSVDKPENQRKFLESLSALDAEAQKRFKKSFPALDQERKTAFLTGASTKPKGSGPAGPEAEEKPATLYSHFENLKGWISGAYYSSEVGMRELGWTGDYAFAAFPGCTHPEGHS